MTPPPTVTDPQGLALLVALWLAPLLGVLFVRAARRRLRGPTTADSAAECALRDNHFGGMY